GGTWLKLAVLDADRIVHSDKMPLPPSGTASFVQDLAAKAVEQHAADTLGVGLAGLVRFPEGELVWGPHLDHQAVPYRQVLEQRLGIPVVVDNDANLAVYAEWRMGAAQDHDPVLMVAVGTGIGVGVVAGGRIFRGGSFAGESGHMTVDPNGGPCACGRRGCWETVVSGTRLDRLAAERHDSATGADLVAWAADGDEWAGAVLAEVGEWLGRGIVTLVLAFDPQLVVVGGAVSAAGELLLEPAARRLAMDLPGAGYRDGIPVVPARFDAHAGAVGAALAARSVQNGSNDW
ncbi:MAG: ROK family protein, partial [Acidimicrobiia bacterium]|nr:ROK family protein [Acidimicrobiia bacterium]